MLCSQLNFVLRNHIGFLQTLNMLKNSWQWCETEQIVFAGKTETQCLALFKTHPKESKISSNCCIFLTNLIYSMFLTIANFSPLAQQNPEAFNVPKIISSVVSKCYCTDDLTERASCFWTNSTAQSYLADFYF